MAAEWKTVRVFISSTFRDMHAERDHLVKVVFPRVRQWCERHRMHLVDIDLRWGVTKEEAENGAALDICLQEIDGCRPFFVCILGGRYGWVPDRLPPDELAQFQGLQAEPQHSITHLEILHATVQPLRRRIADPRLPLQDVCSQAFFYLRREGCIPSPGEIPVSHRDAHAVTYFEQAHPTKLRDLRQWIRDQFEPAGNCFEYAGTWDPTADNPEDAREDSGARLIGRLTELDRFGRLVHAQLRRAIARQFTQHIAEFRTLKKLPRTERLIQEERSAHEAFIENRTQVHVPRVEVERALTEYLEDDDRRPLLLSGPPGSGKSAILANWVRTGLETGRLVSSGETALHAPSLPSADTPFVLARFIGASPPSTNLARLLANVCEELRRRFDLREEVEVEEASPTGATVSVKRTRDMEVPADPKELLSKWPKFLAAVESRGRVVIVLDALNQLDRTANPSRLHWLPRELPIGIKLIVSVLDHHTQSLENSELATLDPVDWHTALRRLKLRAQQVPALATDEQARIIRELPSVFCKTLEPHLVTQLLANPATANPLFLIVALEELRTFGSFERLPARIALLPQLSELADQADPMERALDILFGQVLERLESETSQRAPALVQHVFSWLASAREGLSETEFAGLLARYLSNISSRRRAETLQVVLRQLRRYLMRKET